MVWTQECLQDLVLALVSSIWVLFHECKIHFHHLFHQLLQGTVGQRSNKCVHIRYFYMYTHIYIYNSLKIIIFICQVKIYKYSDSQCNSRWSLFFGSFICWLKIKLSTTCRNNQKCSWNPVKCIILVKIITWQTKISGILAFYEFYNLIQRVILFFHSQNSFLPSYCQKNMGTWFSCCLSLKHKSFSLHFNDCLLFLPGPPWRWRIFLCLRSNLLTIIKMQIPALSLSIRTSNVAFGFHPKTLWALLLSPCRKSCCCSEMR